VVMYVWKLHLFLLYYDKEAQVTRRVMRRTHTNVYHVMNNFTFRKVLCYMEHRTYVKFMKKLL
jgi:hypothetical protein